MKFIVFSLIISANSLSPEAHPLLAYSKKEVQDLSL